MFAAEEHYFLPTKPHLNPPENHGAIAEIMLETFTPQRAPRRSAIELLPAWEVFGAVKHPFPSPICLFLRLKLETCLCLHFLSSVASPLQLSFERRMPKWSRSTCVYAHVRVCACRSCVARQLGTRPTRVFRCSNGSTLLGRAVDRPLLNKIFSAVRKGGAEAL